jgi:hypothetical protein
MSGNSKIKQILEGLTGNEKAELKAALNNTDNKVLIDRLAQAKKELNHAWTSRDFKDTVQLQDEIAFLSNELAA